MGMDNELFLKRLQELAETQIVKAPRHGNVREASEPSTVWRSGHEIAIDKKNNPTLTLAVKKLKPIVKSCEDCGDMVEDRCLQISIYSFPTRHWRKTCKTCKMVCNPETGKFDIPHTQAQAFFTSKLRDCDK